MPRREAETRIAEIRHSGCAVVDDERRSSRVENSCITGRQVCVHAKTSMPAAARSARARRDARAAPPARTPSRRGFGVAVHDADAQTSDFRDEMHGQAAKRARIPDTRLRSRASARESRSSAPPLRRPPIRGRRSRSLLPVPAGDLGLHVAAQSRVPQHCLIDAFRISAGSTLNQLKSPLKTSVALSRRAMARTASSANGLP